VPRLGQKEMLCRLKYERQPHKALHWTGIPLHVIPASSPDEVKNAKYYGALLSRRLWDAVRAASPLQPRRVFRSATGGAASGPPWGVATRSR
jgi:hypothetical protein